MTSLIIRGVPGAILVLVSFLMWFFIIPFYWCQVFFSKFIKIDTFRDFFKNIVAQSQIIWSTSMLRLFGLCLTFEGEKLAKSSNYIYVFNHTSFGDPWASGTESFNARYMFKKELNRCPPLYLPLVALGHISIDRKAPPGSRKTVIEQAKRILLTDGNSVAIAPEGTRNRSGDQTNLLPFKIGAFVISCETKKPIVPLLIFGLCEKWPASKVLPDYGNVIVRRLKPIHPNQNETPQELSDRVREIMLKELKTPPMNIKHISWLKAHFPTLSIWILSFAITTYFYIH